MAAIIIGGLRPFHEWSKVIMSKLLLIVGFVLAMSTLGLAAANTTPPAEHVVMSLN